MFGQLDAFHYLHTILYETLGWHEPFLRGIKILHIVVRLASGFLETAKMDSTPAKACKQIKHKFLACRP